jgi:hypothetical protein
VIKFTNYGKVANTECENCPPFLSPQFLISVSPQPFARYITAGRASLCLFPPSQPSMQATS